MHLVAGSDVRRITDRPLATSLHVAVGPDGKVVAGWAEGDGPHLWFGGPDAVPAGSGDDPQTKGFAVARVRPAGGTFGAPDVLTVAGADQRIVAAGGRVVWQETRPTDGGGETRLRTAALVPGHSGGDGGPGTTPPDGDSRKPCVRSSSCGPPPASPACA